jgi:hypothetical protein
VKVALAAPLPLALALRGLEQQLLHSGAALRALGVEVEPLDPWRPGFDADLLHCFGSEYQLAELVAQAGARGVPVVVSSVFAPRRARAWYALWRALDRALPLETSFGLRRGVLRQARAVVALTEVERDDVVRIFGVPRARVHVIGNGVEERFARATPEAFSSLHGGAGGVLCPAALGRRKNQLRLVEALADSGLELVLVGAPDAREPEYAARLREAAARSPRLRLVEDCASDSPVLASAFAAAHVVALPSLVEVQPLSALQALASGANLVLSGLPGLRASFGGAAWYCDPRRPASIRRAVLAAARAPRGARAAAAPPGLLRSWHEVALELRKLYEAVLAGG